MRLVRNAGGESGRHDADARLLVEGRGIIDPADDMNDAAANALLKTLEEPVPGRYLWLVCANPARLPATVAVPRWSCWV